MKEFVLKGIHCQECSKSLEEKINTSQKKSHAKIDFNHHTLAVSAETDVEKLKRVLAFEKILYLPKENEKDHNHQEHTLHEGHGHSHSHSHDVDLSSGNEAARNVKIVFFVNALFAGIEFIFGTLFNSVAILTDAVHDTGDAISIGLAWFFQKISTKEANEKYSFGHQRFSLLGALITAVVLLVGSTAILMHTVTELLNPEPVNYQGMFWLSIFAIFSKLFCMWLMNRGTSHNENLLNLHMLEDTLGWIGVLTVSVTLHFTDWYILDPLLSMAIAVFIIYKTWPMFVDTVEIFLEATPKSLDTEKIEQAILDIPKVNALSHLHVWSIDGEENILTVTVSLTEESIYVQERVKEKIRQIVYPHNVTHSTIEIIVDKDELLTKN